MNDNDLLIDEYVEDNFDIESVSSYDEQKHNSEEGSIVIEIDDDEWQDENDPFENMLYSIHENNIAYLDTPKVSDQYCIGMSTRHGRTYLLANSISIEIFLQISYENALQYLYQYSGTYIEFPEIDIIKIKVLSDGRYVGVIKTFWLRCIQRKWKQIIKSRKEIIRKRGMIQSRMTNEMTGRYPYGLNVFPTLRRMLSSSKGT